MNTFIDDYLSDPNLAVDAAQGRSNFFTWTSEIDEEMIYDELASGQFRLYEAIIFSSDADDLRSSGQVRPVA